MHKAARVLWIPRALFSSQLRINMVSGVAVTVVNGALMAVAFPLYLHFLGYEQYGVWLVLSTVVSFAQLGNLGVSHAVTKLVAEEHGRNNVDAVQQYVSSAIAALSVSGVVVLAILLASRTHIIALFRLSAENARVAAWLLPYVACLSVYVFIVQVLSATVSGLGRMDLANYAETGGRIVSVAAAGILLYRGAGVVSLLLGSTLSYLFIHVVSVVLIHRMARIRILRLRDFNQHRIRKLLSFGASICGGTLVTMVFHPANRVLLSRYVGVAAISVYEIGFNSSAQIRAMIEAGLRALLPEVSRIGSQPTESAKCRIAALNRHAVGLVLVLGIPLYGVLFLLAKPLLRVWLGASFVETLPVYFRIMLIASLVSLLGVPAYYILMGLGHSFRCFVGRTIPVAVHFLILGVLISLGKYLTLHNIGYAMLASIALSTLYLMAELHLHPGPAPARAGLTQIDISDPASAPYPDAANVQPDSDRCTVQGPRQRETVSGVS